MAWSALAKVTTTFTFDHIQASLLFRFSSFLYFVVFKVSDHSNVTYVVLPSHKKATYVVTTKSILMRNHFNVPFVHIAVVVVMHWMVICAFIQVLIKPTLNILSSDKNHSSFFLPWDKFRTHNRMLWSGVLYHFFHTNYDYSFGGATITSR